MGSGWFLLRTRHVLQSGEDGVVVEPFVGERLDVFGLDPLADEPEAVRLLLCWKREIGRLNDDDFPLDRELEHGDWMAIVGLQALLERLNHLQQQKVLVRFGDRIPLQLHLLRPHALVPLRDRKSGYPASDRL